MSPKNRVAHSVGVDSDSNGLVAIACHFNPWRLQRRVENYRRFRAALGLPLIIVELSHDGHFELVDGDADPVIRVAGGDLLWQKERLLNLALERLPASCTDVVWLDTDIIFRSGDWKPRLLKRLHERALVQPFARAILASPDWPGDGSPPDLNLETTASAGAVVETGLGLDGYLRVVRDGGDPKPALGYAWAARRALLERHSFYDACIIGGGDRAVFSAAYGCFDSIMDFHHMNQHQRHRYLAWAEGFHQSVQGSVGYIDGDVIHLWRGAPASRRYRQRHIEFAKLGFNPYEDIALSESGCWRWNSDRPALHDHVRQYLESRDKKCTEDRT